MAIAGIGVDCCEIERIRRALTTASGRRFRTRVFTDAEQAYCEARRRGRYESYAARFAAKEAVMKVLGTGWSGGVRWRDIEVMATQGQPPAIRLHGPVAAVARRQGIARWFASLSHSTTLAVAFVVAERRAVREAGSSPAASRRAVAAGSGPRPPTGRQRGRAASRDSAGSRS